MNLNNKCPYCLKYLFYYGDGENKTRYPTKASYKDLWKRYYGSYPLGKFYKAQCVVCKRRLAVFEDITDEEIRWRGPVVLFLCTLADKPYDEEKCRESKNCTKCGVLKTQREEKNTLWYSKHYPKKNSQKKN